LANPPQLRFADKTRNPRRIYYQKKISEGKPHRVAVSHVAKKLIRVIYTLETKGIDYDENLLR